MVSVSKLAKTLVIREESAVTIKALEVEDSEVVLIVAAA
jgi:hypothetical protein